MAKTEKPTKSQGSADRLVKPTRKDDIELTEEQLSKVAGGSTKENKLT